MSNRVKYCFIMELFEIKHFYFHFFLNIIFICMHLLFAIKISHKISLRVIKQEQYFNKSCVIYFQNIVKIKTVV